MRFISPALCLAIFSLAWATPSLAADPVRGQKIFKKCASCHTVKKDGKRKTGPNLWNIIGRDVAGNEAFAKKYSKAMKAYGGVWSADRLDVFLKKPKKEIRKTKMGFAGLKKDKDRADLLAFLATYSDASSSQANADTPAEDTGPEYGFMFVAKGVEETFIACTPCHSERIVVQQGLKKADWEELFVWMIEEQDMEAMEEPDYTLVLNYLTEHYGIDRPNFPGKKK